MEKSLTRLAKGIRARKAQELNELLTGDDLLDLETDEELKEAVNQHIVVFKKRVKGLAFMHKSYVPKLERQFDLILNSKNGLLAKSIACSNLIDKYDSELKVKEESERSMRRKETPATVNLKKDETQVTIKETQVTIKETPVTDVVVSNEVPESKEQLETWILRSFDDSTKGAIKQRLGYKLAERRALVIPRLHLNKETGSGIVYDVRIQKNGVNKFLKLELSEYVDGTLALEDAELQYGWLALDNVRSIYPVKFSLVDEETGVRYEAISLTHDNFNTVIGDEHQRYGLYFINGLGLFAANLTKEDHLVLSYLKGKKPYSPDYKYGHNAIVGRSIMMNMMLNAARFDNVIPEGEL